MKVVVVLALAIMSGEAFDCGIHINRNEQLKEIMSKCINNNRSLEDLWDMAPMSSESDSSSSSDEQPAVDGKMLQNFRTRRSAYRQDSKISKLQDQANDTESEQNTTTETVQSDDKVAENCVIHCIFQHLDMIDDNGYPSHDKLLEGLLKNATGRELRDFLQDSTDDCFQEMDKEKTMEPCSYSIKLVTCLAEKGRTNCADWPVGELPFQH